MNCKPGDLAILINAKVLKDNIGMIFEVCGVAPARTNGDFCWWVRHASPGQVLSNGQVVSVPANHVARCADKNLRPISGLPLNEETHDEVTA